MHRPQQLEALVEKQVRRWQMQRAAISALSTEPPEPWPIVSISREAGSRGADVGRSIAERLGFGFWDQELVHEVAERTGMADTLVATLDERVRGYIDEMVSSVLVGHDATASEYVRQVARVVHTLVQHGSSVVVGRGSQFLVTPEHVLRVRLVAPLDLRVRGYSLRHGIPLELARRRVLAIDGDRCEFYRRYFDRDVGDPIHYDLVVNTGTLSTEGAVEVVVAAYRARFRGGPPPSMRH
jgi:cytidylate kinase